MVLLTGFRVPLRGPGMTAGRLLDGIVSKPWRLRDRYIHVVISVTHLSKKYGKFIAVDDLTFEVPEGEVLGFLGPNGAGKTTTMRMITGFLPPS